MKSKIGKKFYLNSYNWTIHMKYMCSIILSFNLCIKNHNLAYKNKNNDLEIHNLVPPKNI